MSGSPKHMLVKKLRSTFRTIGNTSSHYRAHDILAWKIITRTTLPDMCGERTQRLIGRDVESRKLRMIKSEVIVSVVVSSEFRIVSQWRKVDGSSLKDERMQSVK
jgi:hypothetical protein